MQNSENHEPSVGAYFLSLILVLFSFLILGTVPLLIVLFVKAGSTEILDNFSNASSIALLGKNLYMALLMMPFVLGFATLVICQKYILRKPFIRLFTTRNKFDFQRFFVMFFTVLVIQFTVIIINYLIYNNLTFNFKPFEFFILLLICLFIVPIQTGFEELFFRSFLVDFLKKIIKNKWVIIVITGVLFGLVHGDNPEVDSIGKVLLLYYIGMGIFLGILAVFDKGLELSFGFHYANNLIPFLFITNSWQAVTTDALFVDQSIPSISWYDWLTLGIILPGLIFLFHKIYKWNFSQVNFEDSNWDKSKLN